MQLARGAPTLRAGEQQWPDWKRARATQMLRREATRTGNGQEKRSSMSPIGGEMQIKISLEITSLPLGRPPSEPQRVTSNPGGCGETEDSCALLVGMQSGANPCKTWRFLRKLRMELHRGPAIPLPDIYPEERESRFQGEMCPPPPCSPHGDPVAKARTHGAPAGAFPAPVPQDSPPSAAGVRMRAPFNCSV